MRLPPGTRLGTYEIVGVLGAGGMGEVYRGRDLRLGRDVALKILARSTRDPQYVQRFEEEARAASVLNHPNIVTIYGVGEDGDVTYIAMELVHGRTLKALVADGAFPVKKAFDVAVQLADALAVAHAAGIVHRDLKPENVMVTADGLLKVLDFGLAKRQDGFGARSADHDVTRPALTLDGTILGTVGYMSPEQASGRPVGSASDQFSFGLILYELLSGRRAFERNTAVETLHAIMHDEPARAGELAVAPMFEHVLTRCLEKNPGDRYANTSDLAAEVQQIRDRLRDLDRFPTAAPPSAVESVSPPPVEAPAPPSGVTRRRAIWVGGAAAVAGTAGLAAWRLRPRDTGIRSLAVLPFANAAHDEDAEYLCDGITESLINRISRLPSLRVMARSTVFNLKGKTIDPRAAGRQLAVNAILSGTVTRRSERLVITAELVDVATGEQLWGERYDRAATDVLSVQDEITKAIVDEGIRLRLTGAERRRLAQRPTDNKDAYDLYLRALQYLYRENEDDYLRAREILERVVTLDKNFSLAHVAIGRTYAAMAIDGYERPTEAWPKANQSAARALQLEPDLPDAHSVLGSKAFFFDWDWQSADREYRIVMGAATGPLDLSFVMVYTLERWALGHQDDALTIVRKARELDQFSPGLITLEADFLLQTHQFEAAASLYQRVTREEPADPRAFFGLAEARGAQGRFVEAIDARRRGHTANGDDSLRDVLANARGAEGYRQIELAATRLQLEELRSRAAGGTYVSPLQFARAYAQLVDKDEAFRSLSAAFEDRVPGLVFLKVDRAWDAIRDDARFLMAVRKVGLP